MAVAVNDSEVLPGRNTSLWRRWEPFPNPFDDVASFHMPTQLNDIIDFCTHLWVSNGTYRTAMERVVAYFLTEVELTEVDDDERERYMTFLNDTFDIKGQLRTLGLDFMFYGNSFSSVYVPFRRYLRCPNCSFEQPIGEANYVFKQFKFIGNCNKCHDAVEFIRNDRKSTEEKRIRIVRWPPQQIVIRFHPVSHRTVYLWRIPKIFVERIKTGDEFYIEDTPWEFIEAIQDNQELFEFNDNVIYHMKENTLAGIENKGWGIPRAISNFKQAWYIQVLKRYNEAIGLDYIVPFRIITPSRTAGPGDPLLNVNLGDFSQRIQRMLAKHRRDPAGWHTLPFPVEYQALSGEGTKLAPVDLLNQGTDEFLNALGVPAELYRGSLQLQIVPTALRLFESTWPHLVSSLNGWIAWFLDWMSTSFNWEKARGHLRSVTLADDFEVKQLRLMLAQANQISMQTAFAPFGINIRDEIRRKIDEQRMIQEEQDKYNEEMQRTQATRQGLGLAGPQQQGGPGGPGGGPAPMGGGAGGPGTPSASLTPGDIQTQAMQIAQSLIVADDATVRQVLGNLKKDNPTLYAATKQAMTDMRSQARSVGQQQVLSQAMGPGATM